MYSKNIKEDLQAIVSVLKIKFGGIEVYFNNFLVTHVNPWHNFRGNEGFERFDEMNSEVVKKLFQELNNEILKIQEGELIIKIADFKIQNCQVKQLWACRN